MRTWKVALGIAMLAALPGCKRQGSARIAEFGDPVNGAGLAIPVSDDFGPEQARLLFERLHTPAFHEALLKYNCGDPVPPMTFHVALYERREFASRRVQVTGSYRIDPRGRERGLHFGFDYQIQKATADLDPTKKWTRTYRKPGGDLFTVEGGYDLVEPVLDPSKRDAGGEWVTFPEKRE